MKRAARRVHVDRQVLVGIVGLQVQELRDDHVCELVVDLLADEDDALVQKPGVDVEGALAARRLLYDHRYHETHWLHDSATVRLRVKEAVLEVTREIELESEPAECGRR